MSLNAEGFNANGGGSCNHDAITGSSLAINGNIGVADTEIAFEPDDATDRKNDVARDGQFDAFAQATRAFIIKVTDFAGNAITPAAGLCAKSFSPRKDRDRVSIRLEWWNTC